jgi:hypothetical protein
LAHISSPNSMVLTSNKGPLAVLHVREVERELAPCRRDMCVNKEVCVCVCVCVCVYR